MEQKRGEQEAKQILETYGYIFNENYYEDNSKDGMPDLQFINGDFLEVTHSKHNFGLCKPNKLSKLSFDRQLEIYENCSKAMHRYLACDYSYDENGNKLKKQDFKLLNEHYGLDDESCEKASVRTVRFKIKSITDAIINKTNKHKNIDLFVFVTFEEFELLKDNLEFKFKNSWEFHELLNTIYNQNSFKIIFISPYQFVYIPKTDLMGIYNKKADVLIFDITNNKFKFLTSNKGEQLNDKNN